MTDHESIRGRVVIVTGAGGSIGSELVKQIARSGPHELILIDQSELALYDVNCAVEEMQGDVNVVSYLMDIRDQDAMRFAFAKHKPDIVFHAAALKHVPMLENDFNLTEAVRTNVLGTKIVADLCSASGIAMVMISTDKAVNPSSGMGLTKRVAEIYLHGKAQRHPDTKIGLVRFGNVIGSSGSVVPLFQRQIAYGGPVTVTHPGMTRYMMTIKEAVNLTINASSLPADRFGCYVLDMGEPIRIVDLAKQMIFEERSQNEIEIEFVGMRPGEKLVEDLNYAWEELEPTSVPLVCKAVTTFDPRPKLHLVEELLMAANRRDHCHVKRLLVEIVPEYTGEVVY